MILLHFSIDNAMQLFKQARPFPRIACQNDISDRRVSYLWPLCLIDYPFLQNGLYLDGEMIVGTELNRGLSPPKLPLLDVPRKKRGGAFPLSGTWSRAFGIGGLGLRFGGLCVLDVSISLNQIHPVEPLQLASRGASIGSIHASTISQFNYL